MPAPSPRPFLMGAETEYAVSGLQDGAVMEADVVYDLLAEAIRASRAWAADHSGYRGVYLQHGGRFYLDYGEHPEHATPECFTPRQVALYDKAGEHLLALARDAVTAHRRGVSVRVIKNNFDPVDPEEHTFGSHESYTGWAGSSVLAPQLIPHLVSRVLYCGAGVLSGRDGGVGFELSQRARHIGAVVGDDTTCCRAIFSNRIRKVTDGGSSWTRVHLIGKDSQRSPFGIYLTYATTGLLIEMVNRGLRVGKGLALADPVPALQAFSRDPWCKAKVRLADGRQLSALEVQSAYLEECEQALAQGGLPEWAAEAIGHWRATLADLERDPRRLADRLDPYCKLAIYEHELSRAGLEWRQLRTALAKLQLLRSCRDDRVVRAVLTDSNHDLRPEELVQAASARRLLGEGAPAVQEHLLFATRLQALELNYHELGGLYDRLHSAGRMRDVVTTPAAVEEASRVPPPGGRAALRGAYIREHHGQGWRADWQFVFQMPSAKCIDLRDPFNGTRREVTLKVPAGTVGYHVDVLGLLGSGAVTPA